MTLTQEQMHVLQHALGADKYGRWPRGHTEYYRNRYVGESTTCEELVALGLMVDRSAAVHQQLTGGAQLYMVTPDGQRAMLKASPMPPKLSRSQERYRRFLDADCGLTFREFLAAERKWAKP